MKGKEERLGDALLKVALGYAVAEVTEEYAETDGALKLIKRKRTKKDVPPDLKAVQMLLERTGGGEIGALSDEELEREKKRLLRELEKKERSEKKREPKKRSMKRRKKTEGTENDIAKT